MIGGVHLVYAPASGCIFPCASLIRPAGGGKVVAKGMASANIFLLRNHLMVSLMYDIESIHNCRI